MPGKDNKTAPAPLGIGKGRGYGVPTIDPGSRSGGFAAGLDHAHLPQRREPAAHVDSNRWEYRQGWIDKVKPTSYHPRSAAPGGTRSGGVAERLKAADCKSADVRLRRFESYPLHQTSGPRRHLRSGVGERGLDGAGFGCGSKRV